MKNIILSFPLITCVLLIASCAAHRNVVSQARTNPDIVKLIDKNLQNAAAQYQFLKRQTPPDQFPRSLDKNGKLVTSRSDWWCSGFYPGTLLYLYEATKDTLLYHEALKKLTYLQKEQYNKSTHDLGFMMYCSFGNLNRIAPNQEEKQILINSARSLATRFDPKVGCIRSWNSKPSDFLVIIDNMMNLELLFWATKATGDSSFYKIAVTHANTTMKNHFRSDYSSYHQINYNPETGVPQKKKTVQGAFDESAWARGQAWALYGYIVMYRETKYKKYLDQANHIADFILNHPNLPKDKIPYWDFNAPGIPSALRDASAGSVIASALIELSNYNNITRGANYLKVAEMILRSLSSPAYQSPYGKNEGFLLEHSVGNLPGKSEIDVPLSYADYYFVEAMLRYKNLNK